MPSGFLRSGHQADDRQLAVGLGSVFGVAGRGGGDLLPGERTVNGQPGLVAQQDGVTVVVYAFEIADDRIVRIWAILNAGKLRPWAAS